MSSQGCHHSEQVTNHDSMELYKQLNGGVFAKEVQDLLEGKGDTRDEAGGWETRTISMVANSNSNSNRNRNSNI